MYQITKEQRDSTISKCMNDLTVAFHHKAIPPHKNEFNKTTHKDTRLKPVCFVRYSFTDSRQQSIVGTLSIFVLS